MLCRFLEQRYKLNSQPHVHHGNPESLSGNERAIYLYGDPIDAVLSFYRREKEYGTEFARRHYRNLDVSGKFPKRLEDYLEWGSDAFGLEAHFDRYLNAQPRAGLLMVRFDDMWPHLEEVFDFLRLTAKASDFPEKRPRMSKRNELSENQLRVLHSYFDGLISKQEKMADLHYVSKGG